MPKVHIEKAKPVGRPAVDPDLKRAHVSFTVNPLVRQELIKMAKKRGTSVSVVANGILEEALI